MPLAITWLGHSTFLLDLPSGQRLLTDPWLDNPRCPPALSRPDALARVDLILISHGHDDHLADAAAVSRATGAPVVCLFEIGEYLKEKGLQGVRDMGLGGTVTVAGLEISMVPAVHTSSVVENDEIVYLGVPTGFVVKMEDGRSFYFAGDTALFGDMRLIGEVHKPEIAFLPIGDHYTMGPDAAARAAALLGVRQVVPMHFGTFPVLTGTPDRLKRLVEPASVDVLVLTPGETAS